MASETVRVVLYPAGRNMWVAQALEYDIAAQGPKMREAFRRLIDSFIMLEAYSTEVLGKRFAGRGPAPERFFAMFEQADFDITPRHFADDEPVREALPHLAARYLEDCAA
jgi:hypothetical protein